MEGTVVARRLIVHTNAVSGFLTSCVINMIFHFRRSIPAWLLLAAYHIFHFPPLWTFFAALAVWFLWSAFNVGFTRIMYGLAYMSRSFRSGDSSGVRSNCSNLVYTGVDTPSINPYSATRESEESVKKSYTNSAFGMDYYSPQAEDAPQQPEAAQTHGECREEVSPVNTDGDGVKWVTIFSTEDKSGEDCPKDEKTV